MSEHELADAGILPGELGAHQPPQIVRLGVRQADLHCISLDDLPGTLAGEGLSREPGVRVLSAAVKAGEDVGRLDGAGSEPGLDGGVGPRVRGTSRYSVLFFPRTSAT